VELASRGGVGHLVLYHHDPGRTDEQVEALVETCQGRGVRVTAARELDTIHL
jgi:hypothetical protein